MTHKTNKQHCLGVNHRLKSRQRRHEIMFIFSFLGAVLILVGFALGVIEK